MTARFRSNDFARRWLGAFARSGVLTVEGGDLRFNGRSVAKLARLRAGFIVPEPGGRVRVDLERRLGTTLEFQATSVESARDLLRALGLEASKTTTTFRIPSQLPLFAGGPSVVIALVAVVLAMMFNAIRLPPGSVALGFVLKVAFVACVWTVYFALRMKLTVGTDGVLTRDLLRRTFVPFVDVAGASTYVQRILLQTCVGVALKLRDGSTRRFVVGRVNSANERAERIAQRIREALESSKLGDPSAASAALARGGRSASEWVQALRAVGAGANVDLRTPPVSPQTLWRIVEDPRAAPPDRAGAAVALATQLDEPGRARLRVTAEATAAPTLRAALEAAMADDDATVGGALDELERERAR